MSIITKTMAAEVAKKLTEKKAESSAAAKTELQRAFTEMYEQKVNPEILKLYAKHPSYFNRRTDFQVSGNGLSYEWFETTKEMPCANAQFKPDADQAEELIKLKGVKDARDSELRKLRYELETVLWSLRSYKKIAEFLPEAVPFLPQKITTALAVNVSDLRQRLK